RNRLDTPHGFIVATVQLRGRRERLHSSQSRHAGPVNCNCTLAVVTKNGPLPANRSTPPRLAAPPIRCFLLRPSTTSRAPSQSYFKTLRVCEAVSGVLGQTAQDDRLQLYGHVGPMRR